MWVIQNNISYDIRLYFNKRSMVLCCNMDTEYKTKYKRFPGISSFLLGDYRNPIITSLLISLTKYEIYKKQ